MPSTVEVMAARLRAVLERLGAAVHAVAQGQELIDQAAASLAQVMDGAYATEANDLAVQFASAQRSLADARATLAAITDHLVRYLAALGFATTTNAPLRRPAQPVPRRSEWTSFDVSFHRPSHPDPVRRPTVVGSARMALSIRLSAGATRTPPPHGSC